MGIDEIKFDGTMFKSVKKYPHLFASKCGQIYSSKTNSLVKQINHSRGYMCVGIYESETKKTLINLVHRLVAAAWIGLDLDGESRKIVIDHINSNKKDNRVDNLRIVSARFNGRKDRVNKNGYTGVKKQKGGSRFEAQINFRGKIIYLGAYDAPEQAHARYNVARMMLSLTT